ncbi:MAG: hypothetical protein AAGD11_06790 [Planctomycetota bacterium]
MVPCCAAAGTVYDFKLVADGAVLASDGADTAYPSVIRVPDWLASSERASPSANYYMYYGNHSGKHIRMKWAETLEGPWTPYDLGGVSNGISRRGVFDADADPTREDYDHLSAPDVHVDNANERIVMYFHGQNQPATTTSGGTRVRRRHESFVTTSGNGLNFNDPVHAGGQPGHGPATVTVDDITRDVWIGEDYQRAFQKNGRWYSIGKRGIINASPAAGDIWAAPPDDPFGEAWDREDTPNDLWTTDAEPGGQDDYHSPGATFLASSEFANHPRNPLPGERVFSNANDERLNHVSVNLITPRLLEVFFYVREANASSPDRYDDIYRIVVDISDTNHHNWDVARDVNGQVMFDVVVTAEELFAAVESVHGVEFEADFYADPVSLGDTHIFVDQDDGKYLFFSYVSAANGGAIGEGQIAAVQLNVHPDFDYDNDFDGTDFLKWQRGESFNPLTSSDLTAWHENYASSASSLEVLQTVPEANACALILICMVASCIRRAQRSVTA